MVGSAKTRPVVTLDSGFTHALASRYPRDTTLGTAEDDSHRTFSVVPGSGRALRGGSPSCPHGRALQRVLCWRREKCLVPKTKWYFVGPAPRLRSTADPDKSGVMPIKNLTIYHIHLLSIHRII